MQTRKIFRRESLMTKVISIFIIQSFVLSNIAFAAPTSNTHISTLATKPIFSDNPPTKAAETFRNGVFDDMRLTAAICGIGNTLLGKQVTDNSPEEIEQALAEAGILLNLDERGIEHSRIVVRDGVVVIPVTKAGGRALYEVEITLTGVLTEADLRKDNWVVLDKFAMRARALQRPTIERIPGYFTPQTIEDIIAVVTAEFKYNAEPPQGEKLLLYVEGLVPDSMPDLKAALDDLRPLARQGIIEVGAISAGIKKAQTDHSLAEDATRVLFLAILGPAQGGGGIYQYPDTTHESSSVGGISVSTKDSYSHIQDIRMEQERIQQTIAEGAHVKSCHDTLRRAAQSQEVKFIGQEDEETIRQLTALAKQWVHNKDEHVIFIGESLDLSGPFLLQALTHREDWNIHARNEGRPQAHFLDGSDNGTVATLLAKVHSARPDKIRIIRVGEPNAHAEQLIAELGRDRQVMIEQYNNLFTNNTIGLLAAGLVIDPDLIRAIHKGASGRNREWLNLPDADLPRYDAYRLAATEIRKATTGQNISVFMMFSMSLRYFSVYLAQLYNKSMGEAGLPVWFSGENHLYLHSTQQAHKQAVPQSKAYGNRPEVHERARRGTISVTFFNPQQKGDDIPVTGPAHPMLKGLGFRFLTKITSAAYRLSMRISHRPITDVDFNANTPEDLGRLLHFAQVSAAMARELAGDKRPINAAASALERSIAEKMSGTMTADEDIVDGILQREQNVLTFTGKDAAVTMGGILGTAMEDEAQKGQDDLLRRILSVIRRMPKRIESKVITPYRGGTELDHLNPERIKEEAAAAVGMAELFKKKKRIYAISIGGSMTGPLMADALGLTGGPEVIEVPTYDSNLIARVKQDIISSSNPTEIGIVIISKSGVTAETDAIGASVIDILQGRLARDDDIKEHVLFITDPQEGTLSKKAREEGWRMLPHPVLIGGRWSMFSSVGLFYYFLKGGRMEDIQAAIQRLEKQNWDKSLEKVLGIIKAYEEKLNPKKEVPWNERKEALRDIASQLSQIPGMWEGVLDYMVNAVNELDRDTEVAIALDRSYENLVSQKHPFGPQLRAESKSKAGIDFYSVAIWGWNAIKDVWGRLLANRRVYVSLFGVSAPHARADSFSARFEKATWDAMKEELNKKRVPYIAVRTGPMTATNLLQVMQLQYRRLAVDMALYDTLDNKSEGQPGVEETKNIGRAVLASIDSSIDEIAGTDDALRAQRKLEGILIPDIAADQIEHMTEVPMNLRASLGMDQDLAGLIEGLIVGNEKHPGILWPNILSSIKKVPNGKIPQFLHRFFLDHFRKIPEVSKLYLDEECPTLHGDRWIIRGTSLENTANIEPGTANGSNFGIYSYGDSGNLVLCASVQILWGSSVRVTVSNGIKTQDFKLKGNGRTIIEVDRPGEDKRVIMAKKGSFSAMGGLSKERPEGFQRFERDVMRPSLNTSIRFSDSLSADTGLMMNKQGRMDAWMTLPEAFELAQIMETASGRVMIMTEEGMRYVRDLTITEEDLQNNTDQWYVYAGNPDSVSQVATFMDYLGISREGRSVAVDILKELQKIPSDAPASLKATAAMWTLRLKQGIGTLPPVKGLKGKIQETVSSILDEIEKTLKHLEVDETMRALKDEYLNLHIDRRRDEAEVYVLLGHSNAGMVCDPRVTAGEALKLVYGLQDQFNRASGWTLLSQVLQIAEREGYEGIAQEIGEIKETLKESYTINSARRTKHEKKLSDGVSFGDPIQDYMAHSAGIPEEVQKKLGLPDQQMPKNAVTVLQKMVDVYLNDQEIGEATNQAVRELLEKLSDEQEIFFMKENKVWVHSLHWIRHNIEERKTGASVNQTGDISSRLDEIYNHLLIYFARPLVDTIISEEEDDPVKGFQEAGPGKPRIVAFIDPIDGSSQIKEAGTFGMIVTIGVLREGQQLSDFDPRKQILASMDIQFGWPRTLLTFVNRCNIDRHAAAERRNRPEVIQFELTHIADGKGEAFRKQARFKELARMEEGLDWRGLLPVAQEGKGVGLAMGGSFVDSLSDDGHREVVAWLEDTYGYDLAYTGALVNDIRGLLRASPESTMGILHTYGPTGKHRDGRFRLTFEEWHYAIMFEALGGEVSDGIQPMLDNRMNDERPSEITKPFYAGSHWVSKFVMGWRNFAKNNLEGKGLPESEMVKAFQAFVKEYQVSSERLIDAVVTYSTSAAGDMTPVDQEAVRDGLLSLNGDITGLFTPRQDEQPGAHIARVYRIIDEQRKKDHAPTLSDTTSPTNPAPSGSLYSIFNYLCGHNATTAANAISGADLAKLVGKEDSSRQGNLSFYSIKDDLRGLWLHLHLIERAPGNETGKDARYYVPESVKKRQRELLAKLALYVGKDLRPAIDRLSAIYEEEMRPILDTTDAEKESAARYRFTLHSHMDTRRFIVLLEEQLGRRLKASEKKEAEVLMHEFERIRKDLQPASTLNKIPGAHPDLCIKACQQVGDVCKKKDIRAMTLGRTGFLAYDDNEGGLFQFDERISSRWQRFDESNAPSHLYVVFNFLGVPLVLELTGDQFMMDQAGQFTDTGIIMIPVQELTQYDWPYVRGDMSYPIQGKAARRLFTIVNEDLDMFRMFTGGVITAESGLTPRPRSSPVLDAAEQAREHNIAATFMDTVIDKATRAKQENQFIILGLEETWLKNKSGSQSIVAELERLPELLRRQGLDNVIFKRGNGDEVADAIAQERAGRESNIPLSNIIVIGSQSILKSDEFNKLRCAKLQKSALLIGVDTVNLDFTSGIRLIEMYLFAMKLNSVKLPDESDAEYEQRVQEVYARLIDELDTQFIEIALSFNGKFWDIIFTPIRPCDTEHLREINRIHREEIDSKA